MNALCGVFYFMSFSVTVGQTSHNPSLFFTFSVEPHDLNNETPVFCLLAVFLYITVAQEECLDHQLLSQRTCCTLEMEMDFGWILVFFLLLRLPKQCHLDGITRLVFWIFLFFLSLCLERFDMARHVKVSLSKKTSILERKGNIFPDLECANRLEESEN